MFAQRRVDHRPDAIRIAKHLVVPETKNAVALVLDHVRPGAVGLFAVLTAINLDHQLGPMTREIGDEMPDWHLPSEMMITEALAEYSPEPPFGIRHAFAKSARARNGTGRRVMLHGKGPTTNITPPQPLPIEGRG